MRKIYAPIYTITDLYRHVCLLPRARRRPGTNASAPAAPHGPRRGHTPSPPLTLARAHPPRRRFAHTITYHRCRSPRDERRRNATHPPGCRSKHHSPDAGVIDLADSNSKLPFHGLEWPVPTEDITFPPTTLWRPPPDDLLVAQTPGV